MTFKELLKTVVFDDVWTELKKEYSMKDEAFEMYFKAFNQLKELTPEPNHDAFRLVVARVEDGLTPGTFIYDVFGIKMEIEILKKRREEIENGTAVLLSWDEVCKDIGYVDDRTEEEKETIKSIFGY